MPKPRSQSSPAVQQQNRKWNVKRKIPNNQGQIIVCENNFHGRTTTIISFSNDENARKKLCPLQRIYKDSL
jgi:acetylornithine/succinyldiaminopimelate/putrescine aminotransferase